ncbi:MAG TPA: hypothetical protein PKX87_08320, partial [Alphaproteobacteria bacterium]|nr:hypothetical protein [Alphaproteobacteria bacterium]
MRFVPIDSIVVPMKGVKTQMRSFFKENLALVTGLALPLLLIGFFVVAGSLSRATVPDPRHDLVFTIDYYKNMDNRPWTINLE